MDPFDPFAALGLERRYEVATADIQRAYLARSAALHPDLAGDDPDVEERSAALNRARETLDDPERRAVALWRLLGGGRGAPEDDRALPTGFLMEMMETREEIESVQRSKDPAALERWGAWATQRRAEHQARVAELFRAAGPSPDQATLKRIKLELNAWRYVERLIEQMDPAAHAL